MVQKQLQEVLYKKRYSFKFRNIHRKTPVLESLFNKALKETPTQVFSCKLCDIFKNIYFEEHLRVAAFVVNKDAMTASSVTVHLAINYFPKKFH